MDLWGQCRYVLIRIGDPFVMICGMIMMLQWSVGNLDFRTRVYIDIYVHAHPLYSSRFYVCIASTPCQLQRMMHVYL